MSLHLSAAKLCAKGAKRRRKSFPMSRLWIAAETKEGNNYNRPNPQVQLFNFDTKTSGRAVQCHSVSLSNKAEGKGWSRATTKCFNWKSFESLDADFCLDNDCERSRLLLWLQTDNHALVCAPKFSNHSEMAQWSIKQKEFTINWTTMIQLNFFVDDCLVHDRIVNGKFYRK